MEWVVKTPSSQTVKRPPSGPTVEHTANEVSLKDKRNSSSKESVLMMRKALADKSCIMILSKETSRSLTMLTVYPSERYKYLITLPVLLNMVMRLFGGSNTYRLPSRST